MWQNIDNQDFSGINFEIVKKNIDGWHGKLRKKIKQDILFGILFNIAFIPMYIYIAIPEIIYFLPLIIAYLIWSSWETWRIYKHEMKSVDYKNTREFLEMKTTLLSNYIKRSRILTYLGTPIVYWTICFMQASPEKIYEHLVPLISITIFLELFVFFICELHIGFRYLPSIRESKELIKQLESE